MDYPFSEPDKSSIREMRPNNDRFESDIIFDIPIEQQNDINKLPNLKSRFELIENDHENLHKITHMLIITTGFLLTICLGAIYSSKDLPLPTKMILFLSAGLLAVAVLLSLNPLRLSKTSPLGNVELEELLERVCDDQKWHTDWASRFLESAVVLLLIGIGIFALDRFLKSPNILSDLENITSYSIQVIRIS
jgi:hypothetical protein